MKIRTLHLCLGLFCLPFLLVYAAGAMAIAHRSWFYPAGLVRMHTRVPPHAGAAILGLISICLLTLGVTGFTLWIRKRGDRRLGIALLLAGGGLAATLIVSMRF